MKYAFLTIDVEEWYELEYLKKYRLEKTGTEVIPKIIDFLDLLDRLQIKATFFFVADTVKKNTDILRDIVSRGHAVGCHGLDHILLYEKKDGQFFEEIKKAKALIESAGKCAVNGYRASCFSMDRKKLELVQKAGFLYDSSKILFKHHPLYRDLDLTGYKQCDDLVYRQNSFFEYEIPTLSMGKWDIPVSGGGYLRLFPYNLLKIFIDQYEKQHENFLIYVHPFELTDMPLPFTKDVAFKDKFRASIGRKNNLKKLKKIILLLKSRGAEFKTLENDRKLRLGEI